jgi:hypothetical protein
MVPVQAVIKEKVGIVGIVGIVRVVLQAVEITLEKVGIIHHQVGAHRQL